MVSKTIATVRFVGRDVPREMGIKLVAQRVLERCRPGPNGCLLWTGWVNIKGYGMTSFHCKGIRTHRAVWEAARGPIPEGLIVCHTCDTPACNNIDHMWLGTIWENGQDAKVKKRCKYQKVSHCKNGHEFTPENTYINKYGHRQCRPCQRATQRRRYHSSTDGGNDVNS